jgi:formate C-acetyltransferase
MDINVRQFIQNNYTEYLGDSSFLQPITKNTKQLWEQCK